MSATPTQEHDRVGPSTSPMLFDLASIDLDQVHADRAQMFEMIPHRDQMALLDKIVWAADDRTKGLGSLKVRGDEFWVSGHFPDKPMLPGVLMIEAGAQLACYMYNLRQEEPRIAAFLRIDDAVFRRSVTVGEELYLLAKEIKYSPRRFISQIQGVVDDQVCFEARISGMRINK